MCNDRSQTPVWGWVKFLIDAVAPVRCAGCGEWGEQLCFVCAARIKDMPQPKAEKLAPGPPGATRSQARLMAAFPYADPVDRIIHAGKYSDGRTALRRLAELAAPRLGLTRESVLFPIPLGRRRRRGRGYNQAEVIAATWARHSGAAVVGEGRLTRRRETRPQVGRTREDRLRNMAGAFAVRGPLPPGRVILVDDVSTTGSTLAAAAIALRAAGAEVTGAAVLARPV